MASDTKTKPNKAPRKPSKLSAAAVLERAKELRESTQLDHVEAAITALCEALG